MGRALDVSLSGKINRFHGHAASHDTFLGCQRFWKQRASRYRKNHVKGQGLALLTRLSGFIPGSGGSAVSLIRSYQQGGIKQNDGAGGQLFLSDKNHPNVTQVEEYLIPEP
jgi:hypothetical protein